MVHFTESLHAYPAKHCNVLCKNSMCAVFFSQFVSGSFRQKINFCCMNPQLFFLAKNGTAQQMPACQNHTCDEKKWSMSWNATMSCTVSRQQWLPLGSKCVKMLGSMSALWSPQYFRCHRRKNWRTFILCCRVQLVSLEQIFVSICHIELHWAWQVQYLCHRLILLKGLGHQADHCLPTSLVQIKIWVTRLTTVLPTRKKRTPSLAFGNTLIEFEDL